MSLKKVGNFINERISLIVGVGIIISVHWGWYQLQQVPYLVKESERKELPAIRAFKYLHKTATEAIGLGGDSNPPDAAIGETK